jgi:hypothetical protein
MIDTFQHQHHNPACRSIALENLSAIFAGPYAVVPADDQPDFCHSWRSANCGVAIRTINARNDMPLITPDTQGEMP